jgi:hypothetical protein
MTRDAVLWQAPRAALAIASCDGQASAVNKDDGSVATVVGAGVLLGDVGGSSSSLSEPSGAPSPGVDVGSGCTSC